MMVLNRRKSSSTSLSGLAPASVATHAPNLTEGHIVLQLDRNFRSAALGQLGEAHTCRLYRCRRQGATSTRLARFLVIEDLCVPFNRLPQDACGHPMRTHPIDGFD